MLICSSSRVAHRKGTQNGQKRVEAEQSSYCREYPAAFGQKREIVGVGQSDMANNTLCRYCFQGTSIFGKKHRELPFFAIVQKPHKNGEDVASSSVMNPINRKHHQSIIVAVKLQSSSNGSRVRHFIETSEPIQYYSNLEFRRISGTSHLSMLYCTFVPASPDQGHDRPCRRDVGRVFLAGVRQDSPSRRRIPSCYRLGPGRGVVVELGQRDAH